MANDTNLLLSARAVMAAVQHLPENGLKNATLGALQSTQDPAFNQIRSTINPLVPQQGKSMAWVTRAGRDIKVPRVTITYRPQIEQDAISERTRQSNGTTLTDGTSIDVYYDQHKEFNWKKTVPKELLEPEAQRYINALISGNLSFGRVANIDHALSNLGMEMFGSITPTLFKPFNSYVLTTLIAAIGKNKAIKGTTVLDVSSTTAAPIPVVMGWDANGNPKRDPRNFIMDTIVTNQIQNKPIMIGGLSWLQWHRDMKDYRTNMDGLDFVAVYNSLPWVFYYDSEIDTVFGDGFALLLDSNAAAFDTVNYHGPAGSNALYAGITRQDDTIFDRGVIRFNQFSNAEVALQNTMPTMSMGFDVRIRELLDANDQPEFVIIPSISYGGYTRPTGFYVADNTDILHGVTGIFGVKLAVPQ